MTRSADAGRDRVRRLPVDMLIVAGLALLALLVGLLADRSAVSAALSTLLVLVLPGWALYAALNAAQATPQAPVVRPPEGERILLAPALSVAVVVLGSLVLNVLPDGMNRTSWRLLLTGTTLALAAFTVLARSRVGTPAPRPGSTAAARAAGAPRVRDAGLLAAAAVVLGLAFGLGGLGGAERLREPFTQLWAVPRPDGSTMTVGIRNDEGRTTSYQLLAVTGDVVLAARSDIRLAAGETWESRLPIAVQGTGKGIDILLYRADAPLTVYRSVRIVAAEQGAP